MTDDTKEVEELPENDDDDALTDAAPATPDRVPEIDDE